VSATAYRAFVESKEHRASETGFAPEWMPDALFDFQRALVEWAQRKGRAAIFADCGLGKTPMQLTWAQNVVRRENRPVLVIAPLAVSAQTIREGAKFGIEVRRAGHADTCACVYVTNYERLHQVDVTAYAGVVCDESSILKAFDGETRRAVTTFLRKVPYRLLCTATAAPNDYVELGTSSEALGYLGFMDMLARFFQNNRNNSATNRVNDSAAQWRFRGHAERPFWRWVCSWARCLRRPSDLGFDDSRFALPELVEREHVVAASKLREGMLFAMPAVGLQEEREERRRTLRERCETAARLVADTGQPAVCWAHLNDEADLIERLVPDAVQVSGRDSDEEKEAKFEAFASGAARVLVTKPVIGAWGLNWQHCAHMVTFASHSFEQHYQSVRRFWRFGQERPVVVDHVISDGEGRVLKNLQRKAERADHMFAEIVRHMRDELVLAKPREFSMREELPSWL
jgi:hypothetical protein